MPRPWTRGRFRAERTSWQRRRFGRDWGKDGFPNSSLLASCADLPPTATGVPPRTPSLLVQRDAGPKSSCGPKGQVPFMVAQTPTPSGSDWRGHVTWWRPSAPFRTRGRIREGMPASPVTPTLSIHQEIHAPRGAFLLPNRSVAASRRFPPRPAHCRRLPKTSESCRTLRKPSATPSPTNHDQFRRLEPHRDPKERNLAQSRTTEMCPTTCSRPSATPCSSNSSPKAIKSADSRASCGCWISRTDKDRESAALANATTMLGISLPQATNLIAGTSFCEKQAYPRDGERWRQN